MDVWKKFDQNVITHSAAHHLMAVDDLVQKLGYARVSDIARQLNITRGSVSISLKPLREAGLILQDENRHLKLSETGQMLVDTIKTKRLVIKRLLSEVLGVEAGQAEVDACKIEHLISNQSAKQIISFMRFLDSEAGSAERVREAWRHYEDACGHEPSECPSCETGCLVQNLEEPPA